MVGISADKIENQVKFVEKYDLTFPMIPNTAKDIIRAYGAQATLGIAAKRSTFLIGPDGRIAHVWPDVSVGGHVHEVVKAIRALSAEK